MAHQAIRVLAMAYMEEAPEQSPFSESVFSGRLVLAGLCGMIDPPREQAKTSIVLCRGGGIKVIMATGDNKGTASAIAKAIGLQDGEVLTGRDLEGMNDGDLARRVEGVSIFASFGLKQRESGSRPNYFITRSGPDDPEKSWRRRACERPTPDPFSQILP